MKAKMLSLLAGVAMFGAASAVSAVEPTPLTDEQLDTVNAGADLAVGTAFGGIAAAGVACSTCAGTTRADAGNGVVADVGSGTLSGVGVAAR